MKGQRKFKVAILTNELFDPALGRTGGFGWAAREAARCLRRNVGQNVSVTFLHGEPTKALKRPFAHTTSDGFTVRSAIRSPSSLLTSVIAPRPDLLLAIDYRPRYARTLSHYGGIPAVVWARDPRTADNRNDVASLRLPGSDEAPRGVSEFDCTGLARVSLKRQGRVILAAKTPQISRKCREVYGLEADGVLPNPGPNTPSPRTVPRDPAPMVLFLGRLDPIKRPWLVLETARLLPDVQFVLAGRMQVGAGPGSWTPGVVPPNVTLAGEVDGIEKERLLQRAWLLMNTSIYEETPVSWLEALRHGTPIVAAVDSGGLASAYGAFVGKHLGDGLSSVPYFAAAISELLEPELRRSLGESGAQMAMREHGDEQFLRALASHATAAGTRGLARALEH